MDKSIIISPIVTEKAMKASELGSYSFIVDKSASKSTIKHVIKTMFSVNVVNIRTTITKGRKARVGTRRVEIAKPEWKKAIVQLKKGEKISMLEPGSAESEEKVKPKKNKDK